MSLFSINKLSSSLYKTARILRDVKAVKSGSPSKILKIV